MAKEYQVIVPEQDFSYLQAAFERAVLRAALEKAGLLEEEISLLDIERAEHDLRIAAIEPQVAD